MTTYIVVPKPEFSANFLPLNANEARFDAAQVSLVSQLLRRIDQQGRNFLTSAGLVSESGESIVSDFEEAAKIAQSELAPRVLDALNVVLLDDLSDSQRANLEEEADVFENIDIELINPAEIADTQAEAEPPPPWHLEVINIDVARDQGLTGEGVRIGILDTGIDAGHAEFLGKDIAFIEYDSSGFPVAGGAKDFGNHGTHVSAIAAGSTRGVAPGADLAVAAVLTRRSPTGGMSGSLAQILGGYNWLAHQNHGSQNVISKCHVINASLGGSPYRPYLYSSVQTLLDLNTALLVAAIGNAGRAGADNHGSPGNYDNVLGVGAVDSTGLVADFSDWGFERTNSVDKPDMSAPGVLVDSAVPGGGYMKMSGTSMASPMVAGAAALLLQKYPNLARKPHVLRQRLEKLVDASQISHPVNLDAANPSYSRIGSGQLDLTRI